jgi:hypothetical protein
MQAQIYARKFNADPREVAEIIAWTKDDHKFLDAGADVLARKYIPPEWMEKGLDAACFATAFLSMSAMKYKLAADHFAAKRPHIVEMRRDPEPLANEVAKPNGSPTPSVIAKDVVTDINS